MIATSMMSPSVKMATFFRFRSEERVLHVCVYVGIGMLTCCCIRSVEQEHEQEHEHETE